MKQGTAHTKTKPLKSARAKTSVSQSSLILCQERCACTGNQSYANYECEECGSKQCELCEKEIHRDKLSHHTRQKIPPVNIELLCQMECENKNFAQIQCEECGVNFCQACSEQYHQVGTRKLHHRTTLSNGKNRKEKENAIDDEIDDFRSITSASIATMTIEDSSHSKHNTINVDVYSKHGSFLLVDENESLKVKTSQDFIDRLCCSSNHLVKVVSIFGNTGDGKSHTLNHTFFGGREMFATSPAPTSCTIGVWAAYDPVLKVIVLDTEGLLGITTNANQRTRLLLKVLAISDIIIYRTRADRLPTDLYRFLSDASMAYLQHFTPELKAASERGNITAPISFLGPAVIVFHETTYTTPLGAACNGDGTEELKQYFQSLNLSLGAYSGVEYVGTRNSKPATNFKGLQAAVQHQLENNSIRSPREPHVIYSVLKILNEKFNGDITRVIPNTFPDQYFTCSATCLSCNNQCQLSMNHEQGEEGHRCKSQCQYNHQLDNRVFTCKKCYEMGQTVVVVPKTCGSAEGSLLGMATYFWSGYVLECPTCGIIYRSRQFWYGNEEPVKSCVRTEIKHIWPGGRKVLLGTHNAARKLLEGVQYVSHAVGGMSAKPSQVVTNWITDQIAPSYWLPNHLIEECHHCKKEFDDTDQKHHCRMCGQGFCAECSEQKREVPQRGWGTELVRVCDACAQDIDSSNGDLDIKGLDSIPKEPIIARKVGDFVQNSLGLVASALESPLGYLKDSARPSYWVSDIDITDCFVCLVPFSPKLPIHHCRSCGQGVCDSCSSTRHKVPSRGWDQPVRVCDECMKTPSTL